MINVLSNYNCVIFDLDKTLIEIEADWSETRKELKETFSHSYPNVPFKKFKSMTPMINYYVENVGLSARSMAGLIIQKYELNSNIILYEKSIDMFLNIIEYKRVGIVSNNTYKTIKKCLNFFIKEVNIPIVSFDDVKYSKPNPEGINLILKKMNTSKKSSIYIGDKVTDYLAAEGSGIDFMYIHDLEEVYEKNINRSRN